MTCKNFANRAIAILLSVVMLIGMIPAVGISADESTTVIFDISTLKFALKDQHDRPAPDGSLEYIAPTAGNPVLTLKALDPAKITGGFRYSLLSIGGKSMAGNHILKLYYKGYDNLGTPFTYQTSKPHYPIVKTMFSSNNSAAELAPAATGEDNGWKYIIVDYSKSAISKDTISGLLLKTLDICPFSETVPAKADLTFPLTFEVARVGIFSSMDAALADHVPVPEYTVTYKANGKVLYTQIVAAGAALAYPADLSALTAPAGYEFDGWSVAEGTAVNSDIEVVAQWKEATPGETIEYTVTYKANGETVYTDTVAAGFALAYPADLPTPAAPSGYEFDGWSVAEGTIVDSDLEVVAQWKASTTVIFDISTLKFALKDQHDRPTPDGALEYIAPTAENPVLTLKALDPAKITGGFRYSLLSIAKNMAGNHILKLYYKGYDNLGTPFTYQSSKPHYPIVKTMFSANNNVAELAPAATGEDNGWKYIIVDYSKSAISKDTISTLLLKTLDICPFSETVPAKADLTFPLTFEVARVGIFSSMDAALADHVPVSEEPEVEEYTIKFVDEDGTVLDTQTVAEGETPVYAGKAPTKAADAQYTYTFAGWTPAVAAATADATYTATYTATVNKYTVKFVNEDGTELQSSEVAYGATPAYAGETPAKVATAQYTYTFAGWDAEIAPVTGAVTYTATFTETVNKYTVTFVDEDGEVLDEQEVAYGETPVYAGEVPAKEATAQYTYKFVGWTPEVVAVVADATYTVKFEATVNAYTVTWVVEGETVDTDTVAYGETPAYTGETPVKEGDAQYSYEFAGWTPEVDVVTGDVTYTAQFTETVNKYTVTFVANGETVKTETVAYGEAATAPEAPAVEGYTFEGWDAEFDNITGDITVNAIYKKIVKYTVKVQSAGNGTVEIEGYDDEAVVVDDTDLKLIATPEEGYVFDGWYNVTNGANELYSSDVIATFTVDSEDATFEARFRVEVIGAPVVDIVVPEVAGSTITKDEKDDGRVEISVELGGENIDNTVAFWYRETRTGGSMIYLGAGSSITVPPTGSEVDYVPYIVSQDTNEVVVYLGSANDIIEINPDVEPEGPAKYGMEFSGWDETTDGIVTIYKAKYAKLSDKPYTLTIKYVDGGEESVEYQLYDTITATKTASENVEWVLVDIDGNETVISNKADCRFAIMSTDYVTLEERVLDGEAKALVTSQGVVYDRDVAKIRFSASYDLPEGATLLGVGVILANADSVTAKPENINHNTNGVIVGAIENPRYTNFIITKGKVESGDTWYGRPYVTYQIGDKVETIYGTTMICTAN